MIFIILKLFVIYLLFVMYPKTKTSFKRLCCKIYYSPKMVKYCCFYNYKSRVYVITKNCCSLNKISFTLWKHLFSIPFLKRLFLYFFSRNINHIMIANFVLLMYCLNIFIYYYLSECFIRVYRDNQTCRRRIAYTFKKINNVLSLASLNALTFYHICCHNFPRMIIYIYMNYINNKRKTNLCLKGT